MVVGGSQGEVRVCVRERDRPEGYHTGSTEIESEKLGRAAPCKDTMSGASEPEKSKPRMYGISTVEASESDGRGLALEPDAAPVLTSYMESGKVEALNPIYPREVGIGMTTRGWVCAVRK